MESQTPVRGFDSLKILEVVVASSTTKYIGVAAPGSALSDPTWLIKRVVQQTDGSLSIRWANGRPEFENVMNDYASYSYA